MKKLLFVIAAFATFATASLSFATKCALPPGERMTLEAVAVEIDGEDADVEGFETASLFHREYSVMLTLEKAGETISSVKVKEER